METEAAMEVIASETVEADKVKVVVAKEEAVASEEAAKVLGLHLSQVHIDAHCCEGYWLGYFVTNFAVDGRRS